MNYYPVQYDTNYLDGEGVRALDSITPMPDLDQVVAITDEFLGNNWKKMVRNPVGRLKRHCVVPRASYENLWAWDSIFIARAIPEESLPLQPRVHPEPPRRRPRGWAISNGASRIGKGYSRCGIGMSASPWS